MPIDSKRGLSGSREIKNIRRDEVGSSYRGSYLPKNKQVQMDRRNFLKKSAITMGAVSAMVLGGKKVFETINSIGDEKVNGDESEITKVVEEIYDTKKLGDGVSLMVDKSDGLPAFYAIEGGDKWIPIEKEKILSSMAKARESGEVEIALTVDIPGLVERKLLDDGIDRSIENFRRFYPTESEIFYLIQKL